MRITDKSNASEIYFTRIHIVASLIFTNPRDHFLANNSEIINVSGGVMTRDGNKMNSLFSGKMDSLTELWIKTISFFLFFFLFACGMSTYTVFVNLNLLLNLLSSNATHKILNVSTFIALVCLKIVRIP